MFLQARYNYHVGGILAFAVQALCSKVFRTGAHIASSLLLLLVESGCLLSLWLVQRWLFLILVGVVLLNKIGT